MSFGSPAEVGAAGVAPALSLMGVIRIAVRMIRILRAIRIKNVVVGDKMAERNVI